MPNGFLVFDNRSEKQNVRMRRNFGDSTLIGGGSFIVEKPNLNVLRVLKTVYGFRTDLTVYDYKSNCTRTPHTWVLCARI